MLAVEKIIVSAILGYCVAEGIIKPAIIVGEYLRQQNQSN